MSAPRRAAIFALTLACMLQASVGLAAAAPSDPRLAPVRSWTLAIGGDPFVGDRLERLGAFDLVVVDGEHTAAEQIAELHGGGKVMLGYLSVGTIERGRSWYRAARPYRLDYWGEWGEWYADVSRRGFRRLIRGRVAPAMLAKGFDGLFLDNTDMIEGHGRQVRGMRRLVASLAQLVRGRGALLFTQNGEDSIGPTLKYYDGWNREDVTFTYDFDRRRYRRQPAAELRRAQRALQGIAARGLLVTATDYLPSDDDSAAAAAVTNACAAGALPYVSDIGLERLPTTPLTCEAPLAPSAARAGSTKPA